MPPVSGVDTEVTPVLPVDVSVSQVERDGILLVGDPRNGS